MDGFVDVYVRATGAKQRVPAAWLTHPVLGRPFSRTPRQRAADKPATKATPAGAPATTKATKATTEKAPAAGDQKE